MIRHRSATLLAGIGLVLFALPTPAALAAAKPTITSFSPTKGPVGTSVTIVGKNLAAVSQVTFNAVAAPITSKTAGQIKVLVPPTNSGKISVTSPAGTAASATAFTVTLGIRLSPAREQPTGNVLISGSGFSPGKSWICTGTAARAGS